MTAAMLRIVTLSQWSECASLKVPFEPEHPHPESPEQAREAAVRESRGRQVTPTPQRLPSSLLPVSLEQANRLNMPGDPGERDRPPSQARAGAAGQLCPKAGKGGGDANRAQDPGEGGGR